MDSPDKPSFTTSQWRIGPWMRSERAGEGEPPHRLHGEDRARLYVVYGDPAQSIMLAVQDHDGCEALILGQELGGTDG